MLLRCPHCQGFDHVSRWVKCTAKTLRMKVISAATNPIYVCPKCKNVSPSANISRINHLGAHHR